MNKFSTSNLRKQAIQGLGWSFAEVAGVQGVRFLIGIILARLLLPREFGLIGMLLIFIQITQSFLDGGFGVALIQKRDPKPIDICSIFYFNILVGVAAAGLLCLAAPWIASFYQQPVLKLLTRALSLTIVINAFGLIQTTLLTKQIDFKTQTKVGLIATIFSGVLGISLAVHGFGVWSLVIQQIAAALLRTFSLWCFSSWRPALLFSFRSLGTMFGFGSRMLISNLLNQFFENIYQVVIGKLFSAAALGFFIRARTLQDFISSTLSTIVGRVTFPVFAGIQDDPVRIKKGLRKATTALVLVNFPLMVGLAVVARPLVLVMLTEKWAPSIPYIQILCLTGLLYPLQVMNLNVITALGRSDLFLRLEIIKKVLIVVSILVTYRWGIPVMIWGMVVTSVISYYLNCYYNGRLIGYPIWEQLWDMSSYLIAAVLMGVVAYGAGRLFQQAWPMLLGQIVAGAVSYVGLCRILRLEAFIEILQELQSRTLLEGSAAAE